MDATESRITAGPRYPTMVYLETALVLFGSNFLIHYNVFRRSDDRMHFAAFMAVNAFTSF